jgi:tetratricopeptide (TPR) repeat protein
MIAGLLETARTSLVEKRPQDALQRAEQILLINGQHTEGLEIKARAEDAIRAAARQMRTSAAVAGPAPAGQALAPSSQPQPPASGPGSSPQGAVVTPAPRPRRGDPQQTEQLRLYNAAQDAFDRRAFAEAETLLESLIAAKPDYPGAESLLAAVRDAAIAARREAASQAMIEARQFEASADWKTALEAYERAATLDGGLRPAVEAAQSAIRDRMVRAGEDAFARARQYDARGRNPEALALYERALQYLPESHPNRAAAAERATALRTAVR